MTTLSLNARAFVRPVRQRLTADELEIGRRSAAAMKAATDRPGLLANLSEVTNPKAAAGIKAARCDSLAVRGDSALSRLACQLVALANAGAVEAECRMIVQYLADVVAACYAGTAREDEGALREQDARADAIETEAETRTLVARVRGDVAALPALLTAEASARETSAAVDTALARQLRTAARQATLALASGGYAAVATTTRTAAMGGR